MALPVEPPVEETELPVPPGPLEMEDVLVEEEYVDKNPMEPAQRPLSPKPQVISFDA